MAVRPLRDGRYVVETDSGTYVVDLAERTCTCPDYAIRGARCKHLRRVAIEVTDGLVAPPGTTEAVCAVCGERTFVPHAEANAALCRRHRLDPGDLVRDRETEKLLLVVGRPGERADEAVVGSAGKTIAEFESNADYGDHEPVVEAVYLDSLRADTAPDELDRYRFPASRLRRLARNRGAPQYGRFGELVE